VPVDVVAGTLDGVVLVRGLAVQHGVAQPVEHRGHEFPHVRREGRQHSGQVVGGPVAGHVGLAEADRAGGAEPVEERARPDQAKDRVRRAPTAVASSARLDDAQRDPSDGVVEDALRDRGAHRGVRHGRDVRP